MITDVLIAGVFPLSERLALYGACVFNRDTREVVEYCTHVHGRYHRAGIDGKARALRCAERMLRRIQKERKAQAGEGGEG